MLNNSPFPTPTTVPLTRLCIVPPLSVCGPATKWLSRAGHNRFSRCCQASNGETSRRFLGKNSASHKAEPGPDRTSRNLQRSGPRPRVRWNHEGVRADVLSKATWRLISHRRLFFGVAFACDLLYAVRVCTIRVWEEGLGGFGHTPRAGRKVSGPITKTSSLHGGGGAASATER